MSIFAFNATKNKKTPSEIISIYSDCALDQESCIVSLQGNQSLIFKLGPKGLPAMEPLFLSIKGLNSPQNSLKVWFEGRDMDMGTHYMLPISQKDESTKSFYKFKGMIPVCSVDTKMVWLLITEFMYENKRHQIQFQLNTFSNI